MAGSLSIGPCDSVRELMVEGWGGDRERRPVLLVPSCCLVGVEDEVLWLTKVRCNRNVPDFQSVRCHVLVCLIIYRPGSQQRAENSLFVNVSASALEIRNMQYVHLVKAVIPSGQTSILSVIYYTHQCYNSASI